jgi:hypothetical protein
METQELPPPTPIAIAQDKTWSQIALGLALLAFLLALPILWWRIAYSTGSGGVISEVIGAVNESIKGQSFPAWYTSMRASSILFAFIALVAAILALILKNAARPAAIACVLAVAALLVTSPFLTMIAIGGLIAIAIALLGLGVM